MMSIVLIAEHDESTRDMLRTAMELSDYQLLLVSKQSELLATLEDTVPDVLVLSNNITAGDLSDLCSQVRKLESIGHVPIIALGDDEKPEDVASIFDSGANDYLTKPLNIRELLARLRAQLRYQGTIDDNPRPLLQIEPESHQVIIEQEMVDLTPMEYRLLNFLASQPNQWHSVPDLLVNVWQYPATDSSPLVRNHILNLRRKLQANPTIPNVIQSRHNRGYLLDVEVQWLE